MIITMPVELFVYSLFASIIALIGGVLFLYSRPLSSWLERHGVPFAAGSLIVTAMMALLPEAEHLAGSRSYAAFVITFFGVYVLEHYVVSLHHHPDGQSSRTNHRRSVHHAVPMVLVGDTIHNFVDGVAIAAAYAVNPGVAFVTAVSTFLHEVPHEIGDFSILLKAGWEKKRIFLVNVLSASLTLLGSFVVSQLTLSEELIGILLAVAAGIFFYLGSIDFLPFAHEEHDAGTSKRFAVVGSATVLLGALVMAASFSLVPHSHDHDFMEDGHSEHDEHLHEDHEDSHVHTEDNF